MGKNKDKVAASNRKTETKSWNVFSKDNLYVIAFCLLCVTAVYIYPSLNNQFNNWDDNVYLDENKYITHWNTGILTARVNANWAPVFITLLTIEFQLFGNDPSGFHMTSLFLHLINVFLVFVIIYRLSGKRVVAGMVALFFGIHPLHVESVSWLAEQRDVLYTLFYLAAMVAYDKYLDHRSQNKPGGIKYIVLTLLFFILSCLSKGMGETLPVTLVLMDCYRARNWHWKFIMRSVLQKAYFFLLSLGFGVSAFLALQHGGALDDLTGNTLPEQMMFACYSIIVYLIKFVFPFYSSPLYLYPLKDASGFYPLIYYLGPGVLLLLAALVVWLLVKRFKKGLSNDVMLFGILFFLANLVLVLQLKTINFVMMAERYTYLCYLGLLFIACELAYAVWEKYGRQYSAMLLGALGLAAVSFGVSAHLNTYIWYDSISLWSYVLDKFESKPLKHVTIAYNNRGLAYADQGKADLAFADYNTGIRAEPSFYYAHNNRGLLYLKLGQIDQALADFDTAISISPQFVLPHYNKGLAFATLGDLDTAIAYYNAAIKMDPEFAVAYNDRGLAHMRQVKLDQAEADFNKAIELNPAFVFPYYNRGIVYAKRNKHEMAIADYSAAIELKPDYFDVYNDRGRAYFYIGRRDLAMSDYNTAIRLNPQFDLPYYNLGYLYLKQGDLDMALIAYNMAISLNPGFAAAYNDRALVEKAMGNPALAEQDFQKARSLGWNTD